MSKLRDSFLKANNFFKGGNFEEAQDLYEEIIKVNPHLIKAWNNLGVSHIKLGKFMRAIEIITEALKIEPHNDSLWRNLGIAYFQAEEYVEAIKVFKKSLERSPNNETVWCNIGVAHAQLGSHEEAIKAYKYALDLNDRYLFAWKNMCLTYSKMGVDFKYDDLRPNTENAWYFLSKALLIHGLFEDALDACNKALRKNPGFHAGYIFKNKIKSMIKEQKVRITIKTEVIPEMKAKIKREEDVHYQRFKKVQKKMRRHTKELKSYRELSLEEKFKLQQEKFKKRMMELEGAIEIEEETTETKPDQVIEREQGEKMNLSSAELDIEKIGEVLQQKAALAKVKNKLIFIDNQYRNIEECFFIIDGANVAKHGINPSRTGKISHLELLQKKLNSFGITNYAIICDRALYYDMDDKKAYSEMVRKGEIHEMPGGSDADNYILQIAKQDYVYIISNDMFRDKYEYFGKEWIKSKRITFKIFKNSLLFGKIFTVS